MALHDEHEDEHEQERPAIDLLLVGAEASALARSLANLGYRARRAADGRAALALLKTEPVLAVMVDLDVKDIDLRDLIHAMRELQNHAAGFLLASPTRSHEIVAALSHGIDSYLPLPAEPEILVDRLERFLAGALVRWQDAQLDDDGGLYVDDAPTFEWDGHTADAPAPGDGDPGTLGARVTAERDSAPERTSREATPAPPLSYDPANYPPQVHDAATGPAEPAPGDASDSEAVTVHATNPSAARSLSSHDGQERPSSLEDEAIGFEDGEATLALDADGQIEPTSETVAGVKQR